MIAAQEQHGSSRLVSLDAFRGFIMLAMASEGFGFRQVAKEFPNSPVWAFLVIAIQSCALAWLRILGFDSAGLHVHGRRVDGVFLRLPAGQWTIVSIGCSGMPCIEPSC